MQDEEGQKAYLEAMEMCFREYDPFLVPFFVRAPFHQMSA